MTRLTRSRVPLAFLPLLGAAFVAGIVVFPWLSGSSDFNVILITLDTVRADRFGAYGYHRNTTPHIDAFTSMAVRFDQAMTATTFTTPSHASILTGLYPAAHGAITNGWILPEDNQVLAEILRDHGYRTGAFIGARVLLGKRFGFDQGFDDFREGKAGERRPANEVIRDALGFLDSLEDQPFFMWLHFYDAHCPYQAPAPYGRMFTEEIESNLDPSGRCGKSSYNLMKLSAEDISLIKGLYDGELRYLDSQLDALFTSLAERDLIERSIIVIVGDHGEELHDRGLFGHNLSVYEPETRVPLWMRLPREFRPRREPVKEPVSTIDIVPTVLELLNIPITTGLDGNSLKRLLENDDQTTNPQSRLADRLLFARIAPEENIENRLAVRAGKWKLHLSMETGKAELYDLFDDASESVDLSTRRPEVSAELAEDARDWLERQDDRLRAWGSQTVSDKVREQLRALGYVNQ